MGCDVKSKKKSGRHVAAGRKGGATHWKKHREPTIQKYLLARIVVAPNGCWNWILSKDKDGYGKGAFKGVSFIAHRCSYKTFIGPIAKGKLVRHNCDNPSCINPKHLLQGNHKDNMQDMYERNPIGIERIRNSARKIGLKWGRRRFAKMTRKERKANAVKAASARWSKMNKEERKAATIQATTARLMKHKQEYAK